jgi:hypothetical protein
MNHRLSERQRVRWFLILLVTFLIKEKSDKRGQKVKEEKLRRPCWEAAAVWVVGDNTNNGKR